MTTKGVRRRPLWMVVLLLIFMVAAARAGSVLHVKAQAELDALARELALLNTDSSLVTMTDSLRRYGESAAGIRSQVESQSIGVRNAQAGGDQAADYLRRIAALSDFTLEQVSPQTTDPTVPNAITLQVNGGGSFRATLLFLQRLESGPVRFHVQALTISQDIPASGTAEHLHVSVSLRTYLRLPT